MANSYPREGKTIGLLLLALAAGCNVITFANTEGISSLEVCLFSEGATPPPCWVPQDRWLRSDGESSASGSLHALPAHLGAYKLDLDTMLPGLHLYAEGVDADHCVVRAAEERAVPTSGGLTVTMATVAVRECRLPAVASGPGRIVVTPNPPFTPNTAVAHVPQGCQKNYLERYPEGTVLTLSPEPAENAHFVGWEGGCSGRQCEVTVRAGLAPIKARFAAGVCTTAAFCWENPLPQGNPLRGVWASASGAFFAVGDSGTILRRGAPGRGLVADQVTSQNLLAVAGNDQTVWAAGENGEVWSYALPGGPWQKVAYDWIGTRPSWRTLLVQNQQVFAAGTATDTLWFDRKTWQQRSSNSPTSSFYRLWGASSTAVFAAGDDSTLLSHQGDDKMLVWSYRGTVCGAGNRFRALWGVNSGLRWLATEGGNIFRYDPGNAQCTLENSPGTPSIYALGGETTSGEVWAVGSGGLMLSRDSSGAWQALGDSGRPAELGSGRLALNDIWGVAGGSLYAVGDAGIILQRQQPGTTAASWTLDRGHADPGDQAAGNDRCTPPATAGAAADVQPPSRADLNKIYGASLSDIWAVSAEGRVLHWDGAQWRVEPLPDTLGTGLVLNDIWADDTEVWAVGTDANNQGLLLRRQAGSWSMVESPLVDGVKVGINAIAGTRERLFIVGASGLAASRTRAGGDAWKLCPLDTRRKNLTAVALADGLAVIGSNKLVDGDTNINLIAADCNGARTVEPTNSNAEIRGIYALSATDIWAAGDQTIIHKQGGTWTVTGAPGEQFYDVHGTNKAIWFVGKKGNVRVYDLTQQQFQTMSAGTQLDFMGVWVSSPAAVWLVGQSGMILRYAP